MPSDAWKYMRQPFTSSVENVSEKTSERVGLLALAWDRKVQVARLMKSELKIYRKLTLKSSAVGLVHFYGWRLGYFKSLWFIPFRLYFMAVLFISLAFYAGVLFQIKFRLVLWFSLE
ncbi:hypothetical protein POM88_011090 [Heracleum sosnowskyi]|uniref:Uncharacterized protein n=1 Tax=Heracleum sosnowskyi TaxID=360622 RepID=A0AAD8ITV8_9APIA|nr:hypothetical protein POM88_011090 [Heracleum sosnowskyi]